MRGRLLLGLCGLCLGSLGGLAPARAGGLFLPLSGLRPSMQGGAYAAAPEDLYALLENPAGLAGAKNGALCELALPLQYSSLQPPGTAVGDAVQGRGLGLPSPFVGLTHDFGLGEAWQFAVALHAPYSALTSAAATLRRAAAPGRYGAADYTGTALGRILLGAAVRPLPSLSLGLAAHLWLGRLASRNLATACDGVICIDPENPDYDADVLLRTHTLVLPGVQLGLSWAPAADWRLGAAFESGGTVRTGADLQVGLPRAALFDGARVLPAAPQAELRFALPWQARLGGLWSPSDAWRLEAALHYAPWSVLDHLQVTPQNVQIDGVLGLGRVGLPPLQVPRRYRNLLSGHLGMAYRSEPPRLGLPLTVRGGLAYEPPSVAAADLLPMSLSLHGLACSLGLELEAGRWTLMLAASHLAYLSESVDNGRLAPLSAVGAAGRPGIGNGTYRAQANLLGLGLQTDF